MSRRARMMQRIINKKVRKAFRHLDRDLKILALYRAGKVKLTFFERLKFLFNGNFNDLLEGVKQ